MPFSKTGERQDAEWHGNLHTTDLNGLLFIFFTGPARGTDGLTPRQYAVLLTVAQNEGLNQTQLVELTGIDRSTLADIIRRMLKKGMLQRRRTRNDARAYSVKITEQGTRILKAHDPLARRVDERILASLAVAQRERFLQDLNAIVQTLARLKAKEAAAKQ